MPLPRSGTGLINRPWCVKRSAVRLRQGDSTQAAGSSPALPEDRPRAGKKRSKRRVTAGETAAAAAHAHRTEPAPAVKESPPGSRNWAGLPANTTADRTRTAATAATAATRGRRRERTKTEKIDRHNARRRDRGGASPSHANGERGPDDRRENALPECSPARRSQGTPHARTLKVTETARRARSNFTFTQRASDDLETASRRHPLVTSLGSSGISGARHY